MILRFGYLVLKNIVKFLLVLILKIFKRAVQWNADGIILSHNHPSGDPAPSKEDRAVTLRLEEAGRHLGIEYIDHIITNGRSFYSLRHDRLEAFDPGAKADWEAVPGGTAPRAYGFDAVGDLVGALRQGAGNVVHAIALDAKGRVTAVRRIPFDPEDRLMSYRWVIGRTEQLRAERYDILHIQTPFVAHYLGTRLSQRLGIPCVETYHTFFEEYLHHYVPLIPRAVTRLLAKRFSRHQGNRLDGMVVPSHPMLQVLKTYGITTPTEVIPTGMEAGRFVPGDRPGFRRDHAIPQDRPVLLFVGRVAHEKNIDFLLKAVDAVRHTVADVLLVIAGEGPALESLRHEARRLGLGDVQLGEVHADDIMAVPEHGKEFHPQLTFRPGDQDPHGCLYPPRTTSAGQR